MELVVFLKEHLKENINGLSFASKILMDNQRYEEAIELLEPKLINITKSNHEIALCAYNLATSYKKIHNYEKAEKYLLDAFKELPNDEDVITQLFDIYLLAHRVEEAKNLLTNLLSENIRNFCMFSLSATKLNKEALKCIDKSKLSPFFSNAYKYYEYIAKYNDLSDTEKHKNASGLESQLKNIIKSTDNNQYLALTTELYTQQKQIVLDVLKDIPASFMKVYPNLWLLESIFNPAAVIKKYENYDYNLLTKADLHCLNMAYSCLIAEGKNEVVSKNIQKALDSEHNDQNTVEIAFTSALLDNDKEKAKEYINQLNKETQEEVISNYRSSDTQIDNLEQLIELYDAKKIHEYYQAKKQQELLLIKQDMLNVPAACWKLSDGETVTTEDARFIGKYKGKNCYGIISEKLENKLGSNFDRFKKVLEEKGLIYRKFGENGIKFIKNIFEIKIDSDDRVYTNQVYTNENEELLLNFEDYGNHKVVKQLIIGNHGLEFHSDLPSQ
ncbi:MAG: hypothetical protein LN573_02890 [Rickettsia endosymbiont of Oxypoda opaca]|nr:hypothetical protein [Rickettsia endosymbiont of Oxypoda opaca]